MLGPPIARFVLLACNVFFQHDDQACDANDDDDDGDNDEEGEDDDDDDDAYDDYHHHHHGHGRKYVCWCCW